MVKKIPIDIADFTTNEVLEVVRELSEAVHGHEMKDVFHALSIITAFCIDMSEDRAVTREMLIERIDYVLDNAKKKNARATVEAVFGH